MKRGIAIAVLVILAVTTAAWANPGWTISREEAREIVAVAEKEIKNMPENQYRFCEEVEITFKQEQYGVLVNGTLVFINARMRDNRSKSTQNTKWPLRIYYLITLDGLVRIYSVENLFDKDRGVVESLKEKIEAAINRPASAMLGRDLIK